MRKLLLPPAAAAALALAACAPSAPAPPPPAPEQVSAGFAPGRPIDEIRIDAADRLPLRAAALIAPDGSATPAERLQVTPSPQASYTQRLGNDPYAGDVFGIANLARPGPLAAAAGAAPQSRATLLTIVATAWITLPDRVAYRHDWRDYRIRLRFGDPPDAVTRTLPAPPPPG